MTVSLDDLLQRTIVLQGNQTSSAPGIPWFLSFKCDLQICPKLEKWYTSHWHGLDNVPHFIFKCYFGGEGEQPDEKKTLVSELVSWVLTCLSLIEPWAKKKFKCMQCPWKMAERCHPFIESTNCCKRRFCCLILRWLLSVIDLNNQMCNRKHILP